ncbi:hypothetical protein [Frisingicoccus sp.]|uniref:hypothetical protein n=1 Tax=Frisingicoccus sp. TaxID=1918627 RepID=UPI003AB55CDE
MVRGIDKFREYFQDYQNQYVLIGGAACDISFERTADDFRATRDLDMVLIVETLTKEFGQQFWKFIQDGEYLHRAKSTGEPQFYRFDKPQNPEFPQMIELFARTEWAIGDEPLIPVHIDDSVSSLSAILLNEEYYESLLSGREVIDGISILKPTYLIPFKAKAWLDLKTKKEQGMSVDSRDIKKHKNDILRLTTSMVLEDDVELSEEAKNDMETFIQNLKEETIDLKNLKIVGISKEAIIERLEDTYL